MDLKRLLNDLGNLTNLEFERFQSSILHNVKVEIYNFKAKFIFVELIFRLSNRQTNFYQVFTLEMNSLILYFKLRISARFKVVKSLLFYMFKFLFYMLKFVFYMLKFLFYMFKFLFYMFKCLFYTFKFLFYMFKFYFTCLNFYFTCLNSYFCRRIQYIVNLKTQIQVFYKPMREEVGRGL